MDLKDIKTDKTRYDVHDKNLLDKLKTNIPAFFDYKGSVDLKKIAQYIILMYDPQSPMRREVAHYMQRKNECAIAVKFPRAKTGWEKDVEDILLGRDRGFNALMAAYIADMAIPEYTHLIGLLEIQAIKIKEISEMSIDQHTHKILRETTESITKITNKLFGSGEYDEIMAAKKALYEQSNLDKLRLRPEMIIKDFKDTGKLPDDFNPYGEYEVEKSKFVGDSEPEG